jgi:hypothetical protein
LSFGIYLYFGACVLVFGIILAGGQALKPKPTLPTDIVMFPGLKYQAAGDNG